MSKLEDIAYEAHHLGVRTEFFDLVTMLRKSNPRTSIDLIYELALAEMKTRLKNGTS